MMRLDRFLRPEPDDAGCAMTIDVLHVFVDAAVAGLDTARLYPGVAAHLRSCPPCAEDCEGLYAAVRA
jgi:hypothetical protein